MLNKISELETKIKSLDNITGFKKSIQEYNKIYKELEIYRKEIGELEKSIDQINERINIDENMIELITDEQYVQYLNEIKLLNEIFEKLEINEQLEIYQNVINKIKLCDKYLKSCKMEILNIN